MTYKQTPDDLPDKLPKLPDELPDDEPKNLPPGSSHHRAFVGPPNKYDLVSAMQFNLLTFLGLRENHFLLDIGCGSLRGGRLFITYLLTGRYFAIEPNQRLIEEGIKNELGGHLIDIKQPVFSNDPNFTLSAFNQKFDFIMAQSIFSHASIPQIRRCLAEAKKVMKPASIFAATFVKGEKNYEGGVWVYPGCVTYTFEFFKSLVEEHGLACKRLEWPHPTAQTWVVIVNPGNEDNIADIGSITDLLRLKNELISCKDKLSKIEGRPYVKLGVWIEKSVKRIRRRKKK